VTTSVAWLLLRGWGATTTMGQTCKSASQKAERTGVLLRQAAITTSLLSTSVRPCPYRLMRRKASSGYACLALTPIPYARSFLLFLHPLQGIHYPTHTILCLHTRAFSVRRCPLSARAPEVRRLERPVAYKGASLLSDVFPCCWLPRALAKLFSMEESLRALVGSCPAPAHLD
jgi:hypothetical protein